MRNTPTHHTVGVRLPIKLYTAVSQAAESEHRTLSNLIVKLLYEHYEGKAPKAKHLNGNGHDHKAA